MLEILYEDRDIIAVNKPEGVASIAENDSSISSVHSLLEEKLGRRIFIVHRLDKEVSGVILFAKSAPAHKYLNRQFFNRTVKKHYIALAYGLFDDDSGAINKPIREFGSGRMGIDGKAGKQSETKYKVLRRIGGFTLLELNPSTGRRHQLRVHLYSIGHSIVGDRRYGEKTIRQEYSRVMLHASEIEFMLPGEKNISVASPLPDSFIKVVDEISRLNQEIGENQLAKLF